MVETMLAERFYADTKTIKVEEIPIPHPGPGEVLIKVAYCGICHSDLSLISGAFPAELPVITQGHECSGEIVELGPGVEGWEIGDRVSPSAGRPCGKCRRCQRGDYDNCLDLRLMAFAFDGAWAQYCISRVQGLTRIPEGVDMRQAAILPDAVATPFGAVVRTGKVHPGNAVGVWGLGGVGTHIMQLAKLAGALPVIAVDVNDAALERAQRLGADFMFRSDDPDLRQKIFDATRGRMIDVAFDAVGISPTVKQAVSMLDNNGRCVCVGISAQQMEIGPFLDFTLKRKEVVGHLGYKNVDISILAEILEFGRLDLSESISDVVSLPNIETGIYNLAHKVNNPIRILVDPWMDV